MDLELSTLQLDLDLNTAIRTLPTTPEAVALHLRELGIRGGRGCCACPLALYLRGRLLHSFPDCQVYVSAHAITATSQGVHAKSMRTWLSEFIHRYDQGCYPGLEGWS